MKDASTPAKILVENNIRHENDMIKLLKIKKEDLHIFNAFMNWQRNREYNNGYLDGRNVIKAEFRDLLDIKNEND